MNKQIKHILVLCEDEANQKIAIGFSTELDVYTRQIQVLPPAGGWKHVLDKFTNTYIKTMHKYPDQHIVLMIDFDHDEDRLETAKMSVPSELLNRVIILGARPEPETLRTAGLGTFAEIGQKLARDCRDNTSLTWDDPLLKHNSGELQRMAPTLKPILFP
jgi:hypothetical protein